MTSNPRSLVRDMAWVPGGSFLMGSNDFYPEECPIREAYVDGFWMDLHPVTNAAFRRFVQATGYVTIAERPLEPAHYPDVAPEGLVPGGLVFRNPGHPVPLDDVSNWWVYVPGACWKHPEGPGSSLAGRERHPVVQIAHADALAYAAWAGKQLPTEAEWERAARGGLVGATFVWGNEYAPRGRMLANTWQGRFPWENLATDGYVGTSPAGAFPANGYGLFDMAGNVWQWTRDLYQVQPQPALPICCSPTSTSPATTLMTIKGGSHLCAANYCLRYRPAARQGQAADTATSHIGFRCILRVTP